MSNVTVTKLAQITVMKYNVQQHALYIYTLLYTLLHWFYTY